MQYLLRIEGVCSDPSATEPIGDGVVIDSFALSLRDGRDKESEARDRVSVQISRTGDEASIDLLRLAVSRSRLDEVAIVSSDDDTGPQTRIVLLDAIIEEFVTLGSSSVRTLDENVSISASGIIYEHGSRRFDERRAIAEE